MVNKYILSWRSGEDLSQFLRTAEEYQHKLANGEADLTAIAAFRATTNPFTIIQRERQTESFMPPVSEQEQRPVDLERMRWSTYFEQAAWVEKHELINIPHRVVFT